MESVYNTSINAIEYYKNAEFFKKNNEYDKAYDNYFVFISKTNQDALLEIMYSLYNIGYIGHKFLNKNWEICEYFYIYSHVISNYINFNFIEPLYELGVHYHEYINNNHNNKKSYIFLKKAYLMLKDKPNHEKYLKIVEILSTIAYYSNEFIFGEEISNIYLSQVYENTYKYSIIKKWNSIYSKLNSIKKLSDDPIDNNYIILFSDKSKENNNLLEWIINLNFYLKNNGFNVVIFTDVLNNTNDIFEFLSKNIVKHCFVIDSFEYLPSFVNTYIENIHYLSTKFDKSTIMIDDDKIKNILFFNEVLKNNFINVFSSYYTRSKIIEMNSFEFTKNIISNKYNKLIIKEINDSSNKNLLFLTVFESKNLKTLYTLLYNISSYNINKNFDVLIYTNKFLMKKIKNILEYINLNILFTINDNPVCDYKKMKFDFFNLENISFDLYDKVLYIDDDTLLYKLDIIFENCKEYLIYLITDDNNIPIHSFMLFNNSENIKKLFEIIKLKLDNNVSLNDIFVGLESNIFLIHNNNLYNYAISDSIFCNKNIIISKNKDNQLITLYNQYMFKKTVDIHELIIKVKTMINNNLMDIIKKHNEPIEGGLFNKHFGNDIDNVYNDKIFNLIDLILSNDVKNVLEIGFNAGFSTFLILLLNENINITCVDICEHSYTLNCAEKISNLFPNRMTFIKGNSLQVLTDLVNNNKKYDMIHIDGGHSIDVVYNDVNNCIKLSENKTFIIMDDYDFPSIKYIWDLFVEMYDMKKYIPFTNNEKQDIRIFRNKI